MPNDHIYRGVKLAENTAFEEPGGDWENNPYGIGTYSEWMDEYGVLKHPKLLRAEDGEDYIRPLFPALELGTAVGERVIDSHWGRANGDTLEFAMNYTLGYNHAPYDELSDKQKSKVQNYAKVLNQEINVENQRSELGSAMGNMNNIIHMEEYREQLHEMFPFAQSEINKNLESGEIEFGQFVSDLEEKKSKIPTQKNWKEEGALQSSWDAMQVAGGQLMADWGGGIEWLDSKFGIGETPGANSVADWMKDAGNSIISQNTYEVHPELADFNFGDMWTDGSPERNAIAQEFWVTQAPQIIPSVMSLLIPAIGSAKVGGMLYKGSKWGQRLLETKKAYENTKTGYKAGKMFNLQKGITESVFAGSTSRGLESVLEAGSVWTELKNQGFDNKDAGIGAQTVFQNEMKLVGVDMIQMYTLFGKLPFKHSQGFAKWFNRAKFPAGALSEGYEEVWQEYAQELGRASVNDEITDPDLVLDIRKMDGETKRAFAMGVIGGGFFGLAGVSMNPETYSNAEIDRILEDEYVKYQNKQEAMDSMSADFGEFSEFLAQVTHLPALAQKIKIGFTDKQIRQIYSTKELDAMGYGAYVEDFKKQGYQLDNSSPKYSTELGGEQFELPFDALNTFDKGTGDVQVIFGNTATATGVMEDVVEAMYNRLSVTNPDLFNEIQAWIQRTQGKGSQLTGRELFSQAFTYNYLNISDSSPSTQQSQKNIGDVTIPNTLGAMFEQEFIMPVTGENLITQFKESQNLGEKGERVGEETLPAITQQRVAPEDIAVLQAVRKFGDLPEMQSEEEKSMIRMGDIVRWSGNQNPMRVKSVEDGFVLFEGEATGVPIEEVMKTAEIINRDISDIAQFVILQDDRTATIYEQTKPKLLTPYTVNLTQQQIGDILDLINKKHKPQQEALRILREQRKAEKSDIKVASFKRSQPQWSTGERDDTRNPIHTYHPTKNDGFSKIVIGRTFEDGLGWYWIYEEENQFEGVPEHLKTDTQMGGMSLIGYTKAEAVATVNEHIRAYKEQQKKDANGTVFGGEQIGLSLESNPSREFDKIADKWLSGQDPNDPEISKLIAKAKERENFLEDPLAETATEKAIARKVWDANNPTIAEQGLLSDDESALEDRDMPTPPEGAKLGFLIPTESAIPISMEEGGVRMKVFMRTLLDAYRKMKPDGEFTVYLPKDISKARKETLKKLLVGTDVYQRGADGKIVYKKNDQGVMTKQKSISKTHSGLFSESKMTDHGDRWVFNGKKQVGTATVSLMGIDQLEQQLGLGTKVTKSGLQSRQFTKEEFEERLARITEIGVTELVEENDSVFEALAEIEYEGKGMPDFIDISLNWYGSKVDDALKILENTEIPSLKNDPDKKRLARVLLALTSPNKAVGINYNIAVEILKHIEVTGVPQFSWKKSGKSATFRSATHNGLIGLESAIAGNIEQFFRLAEQQESIEGAIEWLMGKHSPVEVDAMNRVLTRNPDAKELGFYKPTSQNYGYELDKMGVYGAEVFGSKVGSFVMNILGSEDMSTMDLWMTRAINRWMGEPFKMTNADVTKKVGDKFFSVNDKEATTYITPGNRQNFLLFRQAINNISNDQRVTDAFADVNGGKPLTARQVQALLWYTEKALFKLQNARGQKPLGESDYGGYAKVRQEIRKGNQSYTGLKDPTENESNAGETESDTTGSERPYQSVIAEGTEGAKLGRITFNQAKETDDYEVYFDKKKTTKQKARIKKHDKLYSKKKVSDLINTFSTQIGKIHHRFPALFRKYQYNAQKFGNENMLEFSPLIGGLKALEKKAKKSKDVQVKRDYMKIDLELKNGNIDSIKPLLEQYGLYEFVKQSRNRLNVVAKQLEDVGYDAGFVKNYMPRTVNDHINLLAYIKEHFGQEESQAIEETINDAQNEKGRLLREEEMVELAQTVLLGRAGHYTSKPNNLRVRKIQELNHEANTFYEPLYKSLGIYSAQISEAIMSRQFLGSNKYQIRKLPGKSAYRVFNKLTNSRVSATTFTNKATAFQFTKELSRKEQAMNGLPMMGVDHMIDSFMVRALTEYNIDPRFADRIQELLRAYFNRDTANTINMNIRTVGYIDTMGSVFSAITQLADLGLSVWRAGTPGYLTRLPTGLMRTLPRFIESLVMGNKGGFSKDYITKKDLGIDVIEQEMRPNNTVLGKALDIVFTITGVKKLDQVGKDTTVNATIDRFRRVARKGVGAHFDELSYRLNQSFDNQEVYQIFQDLISGEKTELIKLLAYTELLKVQPVGKSEVPVQYLRNANGRIFYQLKTFMLKRFDVYRDEISYIDHLQKVELEKGNKAKANMYQLAKAQRLAMLCMILLLAEMGADEIKNMIRGTNPELSDRVLSNLLKTVGLSRFTFWTMKREGTGSAIAKTIAPPIFSTSDDVLIRDVGGVGSAYAKGGTREVGKYLRKTGLRTYRHIPILGKHVYFWNESMFGDVPVVNKLGDLPGARRGALMEEKYNKKTRRSR